MMRVFLWLRLAALQAAYFLLFGRVPERRGARVISSIVVYRTCALGDFLLCLPALAALRSAYPSARIVLLTTTTTKGALGQRVKRYSGTAGYPWLGFAMPGLIDEAITFDGSRLLPELARLQDGIRRLNPDLAVILAHPGEEARKLVKKLILLRLLGLREVYGWRARATISHFRQSQNLNGMYQHKIFGPLDSVLEVTGTRGDSKIRFAIDISASSRGWAAAWAEKFDLIERRLVAIAPGSVQPHKRWPTVRFAELAQRLAREDPSRHFVVVGTAEDALLHEQIVQQLPTDLQSRIHSIAGQASVAEAAAVLERCQFLVSNDGGAGHLAAAIGCPVVAIIPGLEFPGVVDPWGWRKYSVRNEVQCAPCYSFNKCPLGHNRCMTEISVDSVLAATHRLQADLSLGQHFH